MGFIINKLNDSFINFIYNYFLFVLSILLINDRVIQMNTLYFMTMCNLEIYNIIIFVLGFIDSKYGYGGNYIKEKIYT